jgi:hypothetical protein
MPPPKVISCIRLLFDLLDLLDLFDLFDRPQSFSSGKLCSGDPRSIQDGAHWHKRGTTQIASVYLRRNQRHKRKFCG